MSTATLQTPQQPQPPRAASAQGHRQFLRNSNPHNTRSASHPHPSRQNEKEQINKLKEALFPRNSLQERIDNFAVLYAIYGKEWLQMIYDNSKGLAQEFGVVTVR